MQRSRFLALTGLLVVGAVVGLVALTGSESSGPSSPADAAVPSSTASASAAPSSAASSSAASSSAVPSTDPSTTMDPDVPDLPDRGPPPELREIDGWLQSEVSSLEELRGKVVAVQFWTFACRNCQATMPHLTALYEKYGGGGDDFEIVGIHAPEFDFEADPEAIVDAAAAQGVTWPIVLDTDKRAFHSWQEGARAFWPRIYLLDRGGDIRYDHIGEGHYDEIDAAVGALLAEPT